MGEQPWRDKDRLEELYSEKGKQLSEIADIFDCSKRTVSDWVNRHGLERRQNTGCSYDRLTEKRLRKMYCVEDMSQYEIADEIGCTQVTVSNKMMEFNIDIDRPSYPELRDRDWLYEEYFEKEKSARDIADGLGCTFSTVLRWLHNHDIELRDTCKERPPYFHTTHQGYEIVASRCGGDLKSVSIHQLLAIADGETPDKIFSNGDFHVHHKNEITWDNRDKNIEVMSSSEHARHHALKQ